MISAYIIPAILIGLIIYSAVKKVKPYDAFIDGAKGAIPLAVNLFPYLAAIFIITELFEVSGLTAFLTRLLSPLFGFFGIPKELTKLVLIKPFSGSGSLAVLTEIFETQGVNSYLSRCACVIYGSSETTFYIASVYFAGAKNKKLFKPIAISLFASFFSCVFACFICKIM